MIEYADLKPIEQWGLMVVSDGDKPHSSDVIASLLEMGLIEGVKPEFKLTNKGAWVVSVVRPNKAKRPE